MVQVHAGSVTNVTESTNPSTRLDGTVSDVDSAGAAVPCRIFSSLHYRIASHCMHVSHSVRTSTLLHRYLPTVLAYSAPGRLQDCSTSHPTSANHLRGCANPHPSHETHPSRLIKEVSRATHPLTIRACLQVFLRRSRQLLHESSWLLGDSYIKNRPYFRGPLAVDALRMQVLT